LLLVAATSEEVFLAPRFSGSHLAGMPDADASVTARGHLDRQPNGPPVGVGTGVVCVVVSTVVGGPVTIGDDAVVRTGGAVVGTGRVVGAGVGTGWLALVLLTQLHGVVVVGGGVVVVVVQGSLQPGGGVVVVVVQENGEVQLGVEPQLPFPLLQPGTFVVVVGDEGVSQPSGLNVSGRTSLSLKPKRASSQLCPLFLKARTSAGRFSWEEFDSTLG